MFVNCAWSLCKYLSSIHIHLHAHMHTRWKLEDHGGCICLFGGGYHSVFALFNSRALTSASMRAFTWQKTVQYLLHLVAGACMPAFSDIYLVFKNPFCSLLFPLYFSLVTEGQARLHHCSSPCRVILLLGAGQRGGVVRVRRGSGEWWGAQEKYWKSSSVVVRWFLLHVVGVL